MILKTTSEVLRIITSSTATLDIQANHADHTTTTFSPTSTNTKITTATTTTIISAPAASTQRQVRNIMIHNTSTTTSNTITIEIFDGTNSFKIFNASIGIDEHVHFNGTDWIKYNASGIQIEQNKDDIAGDSRSIFKVGTAPKGPGSFYCFSKDSGFPGAWSPGTPGVAGRTCDGTNAADAGGLSVGNPASGSWYIRDICLASTQSSKISVLDFLWVNTALVVTTTTAQTVNSVAWPARDISGSTNGEGIQVGILVTTATTNAAAVTNTTLNYTNSDGVAGRTATITSFPATAVVGTFVKFQLQAGDKGVRSIQSITLGTSYVTGSISLVAFKQIGSVASILANSGSLAYAKTLDIPIYNGHCLIFIMQANSTTATTIDGEIYFINK